MNIGGKVDLLHQLREQRRDLEKQIKALNEQSDAIEVLLFEHMDREGIAKTTGKKASVGIRESIVPTVQDWDLFYAFLHKKKAYHLLERRPSVAGCRELFETKNGIIPGVTPFTKRSLSLATIETT